jgi:4-hydroxy-tetrahydrodipicolinate synthase
MIRTDAPPFGRLLTAMVTPFDEQLKVDATGVARLVDHLILTGTETIVVAGTTGESPTLEKDEKADLLKLVIKEARGRCKTIMGTGSNDTLKSAEATKQAEALGADGILVVSKRSAKPRSCRWSSTTYRDAQASISRPRQCSSSLSGFPTFTP